MPSAIVRALSFHRVALNSLAVFCASALLLNGCGGGMGSNQPTPATSSNPAPSSTPPSSTPATPSGPPSAPTSQTRFLYVGAETSGGISIQGYSVDPVTGIPAPLANATTVLLPNGIAGVGPLQTDRAGKFLFVLTSADISTCSPDATSCPGNWYGSNAVASFRVDGQSGALTPAPSSPLVLPQDMYCNNAVLSPDGNFLYVESSKGLWIFRVDTGSGALSQVAGTPVFATSGQNVGYQRIAFAPSGRVMYSAGGPYAAAYAVDGTSGVPSQLLAYVATNTSAAATTLSADGSYFFISGQSGVAVLRTGPNGALSPAAGSPFAALVPGTGYTGNIEMTQLLSDPLGRFVLAAPEVPPAPSTYVFTVDVGTGTLSPLGGASYPTAGTIGNEGMAEDAGGRFLYLSGNGGIATYSISTTGALTEVSNSGGCCGSGGPIVAVTIPSN